MKKDEKKYLSMVADLGCIACERLGFFGTPAEIHHVRFGVGTSQRASHYDVIPLCPHHHRTGGYGEAIHAGQKIWQEQFGSEEELLNEIRKRCNMEKTTGS